MALSLIRMAAVLMLALSADACAQNEPRAKATTPVAAKTPLPDRAKTYLPLLRNNVTRLWPSCPYPVYLAGQVEQETCPSLKSEKCWNPRAELKTSREYGFGLGQITVTDRFDNFAAAKGWDSSLKGWTWENRFDPDMQLKALVAYDRNLYLQIRFGANPYEKMAFMFSAYNGGLGGLLKDRRMCAAADGCNPDRWFGHVELHSFRAKTAVAGYGKSFFEINREYVRNIMLVRSDKYEEAFR